MLKCVLLQSKKEQINCSKCSNYLMLSSALLNLFFTLDAVLFVCGSARMFCPRYPSYATVNRLFRF